MAAVVNSPPRRHSSAVEQLFRKQQVLGSNPSVGSTGSRSEAGREAGFFAAGQSLTRSVTTAPDRIEGSLGRSEALSTHAYVIVETLAVARRRYGPAVTADLIDRVIPALDVAPVDAELHVASVAAFRDTVESSVSLVDRTSFAVMHREGIERAIALDADFRTAGFETLP